MTVKDDGGNTATATAQVSVGSALVPFGPVRLLDTRTGSHPVKVGLGGVLRLRVAGVDGIPATGVSAVTLNLTAIAPAVNIWLCAYPDGSPLPGSSNLSVAAGTVRAGLALVPIGPDGSIDIYNASGNTNIAADIEGYYLG